MQAGVHHPGLTAEGVPRKSVVEQIAAIGKSFRHTSEIVPRIYRNVGKLAVEKIFHCLDQGGSAGNEQAVDLLRVDVVLFQELIEVIADL